MSGLPNPRIPSGPIADAWQRTKEGLPLISQVLKHHCHQLRRPAFAH